MLIEKESDVALGQSSRNDGVVHAGIDLHPNTKKLTYSIRGNKMYDKWSEDLDVPFKRTGQFVLFLSRRQRLMLPLIKIRAAQNKTHARWASPKEIKSKIPNIKLNYGGIFCRTAALTSPYLMTIALAENAAKNGARVELNTILLSVQSENGEIKSVKTNRGTIFPKVLINAAGVFSDKVAEMAGDRFFTILPRRGTDAILDKKVGNLTNGNIIGLFDLKGRSKSKSKGGGVLPTVDGNILVGPTAQYTFDRENYASEKDDIDELFSKHGNTIEGLKRRDIITYFSGTRAANYEEEFIIEKSPVVKNLVQAAAVQSPGVTAIPAIAEDAAKFAVEILGGAGKKESFVEKRKGIVRINELTLEERGELIKKNPDYGVIICRCEEVSKGEILDAISSPIPCNTLDGIKRRVRAGMGRCQGGFCAPLVTKLIADAAANGDLLSVEKKGGGRILVEKTK